jgi:hypothetical protein
MHAITCTDHNAMHQKAQFSKSKIPCLLRHRGGKDYVSAKVAGKVIRRSLETNDFNVAKNRLPAALAEMKGAKNVTKAVSLGIAIQEEAGRVHPPQLRRAPDRRAHRQRGSRRPPHPIGPRLRPVSLSTWSTMAE